MRDPMLRHPCPLLGVLAAIGALAGCASDAPRASTAAASTPAAVVEAAYTCADGRRIEARYDNRDPAAPGARVLVDGRSFEMFSVIAASGARYSSESGLTPDHGLQWWTKGDEATLSEILMDHTTSGPVVLTTCTRVREG